MDKLETRGFKPCCLSTKEGPLFTVLDFSAVPQLKQKTPLPVIIDPSHAAGTWRLVEPLPLAAAAAGADGRMVEVHPVPAEALSDGEQSLKPDRFAALMEKLRRLLPVIGRTMG